MKGILLAGGRGTRLAPLTNYTNKALLPVGDVPLLHFPLTNLTHANVSEICIVARTEHATQFAQAFKNGETYGCEITYRFQDNAEGIAAALRLCRRWAGKSPVFVILGDTLFKHDFFQDVQQFDANPEGCYIYTTQIGDPSWCAQIEFDAHDEIKEIHEKPHKFYSYDVVTGAYMYDRSVWSRIEAIKPSARGELEITDLNRSYLRDGKLIRRSIPKGCWHDAGTDFKAYQTAQTFWK